MCLYTKGVSKVWNESVLDTEYGPPPWGVQHADDATMSVGC
jgi:hypothetical protein